MKALKIVLIILLIGLVLWGIHEVGYMNGKIDERKRSQAKSYTVEGDIHNVNEKGKLEAVFRSDDTMTGIDTRRCFYQLALYTMQWRNIADRWEAYLYVPAGMGEAVKGKLESLDFIDGVIIRNSELYEHPADDRLEIELSKRADKDHAEMLDVMLPGIMDAVKQGL